MGLISLKGMRFFAYHGVYEEEQLTGNYFVVNIEIETDVEGAAMSDEISDTINYETVFLIVQAEMRKTAQLLEQVVQRILQALKHQFVGIQSVKIHLRKENPLPGELVASASIEIEDSFVSACPRCGKPFICYNDDNCWCKDVQIHPKTQQTISQQYSGCLCGECLSFYAG